MGSPVTAFEIVESIRFFAQLVSTEGIDPDIKATANTYIRRLMEALESSVNETTATKAGLKLV